MCGVFGYGGFEVPKYNTFIEDKNGERIDFILDVAKRSRLNMGMRDGILTVRVPYGCSKQQLESFINNNLGWIREQKTRRRWVCRKISAMAKGSDFWGTSLP